MFNSCVTESDFKNYSDEEIYSVLREPLNDAIMLEGLTFTPQNNETQRVEFSFPGWMTGTKYGILFTRRNCNPNITAVFYGDTSNPIPLQEFIIQMIVSKNNTTLPFTEKAWLTDGMYIWKLHEEKFGKRITAIRKDGTKSFAVYLKDE